MIRAIFKKWFQVFCELVPQLKSHYGVFLSLKTKRIARSFTFSNLLSELLLQKCHVSSIRRSPQRPFNKRPPLGYDVITLNTNF